VALVLAVNAEGKSLEDIATPLSSADSASSDASAAAA
jgi:hypothetical protein